MPTIHCRKNATALSIYGPFPICAPGPVSYTHLEIGGEDSVAQLSDYASNGVVYYCMYDEDKADGHIQKNKWRKTWRPEDAYEEYEDEDKYWYWLEKDGKAYIPDSDDMKATGYAYDLGDGALEVDGSQFSFAKKKINSKDYFFNADGEMLSDFVNVVHTEDANVIDLGTVSYTHLDVYKRQVQR